MWSSMYIVIAGPLVSTGITENRIPVGAFSLTVFHFAVYSGHRLLTKSDLSGWEVSLLYSVLHAHVYA